MFYVDSKGNVKEFFGSRFWPFSARVQMVFRTFRICSATSLCLHRLFDVLCRPQRLFFLF